MLAPILFNLYPADLGEALKGASLVAPRLGSVRLPVLQYADNTAIMDHTKVGLQRALNALNHFNIINNLTVNQGKTKFVIFGTYHLKKKAQWQMGNVQINLVASYNYLGVWLMERAKANVHLKQQSSKASKVTHLLKQLSHHLISQSASSILTVLRAKLLPAISYGHLAFPVLLDAFLNSAQVKA